MGLSSSLPRHMDVTVHPSSGTERDTRFNGHHIEVIES